MDGAQEAQRSGARRDSQPLPRRERGALASAGTRWRPLEITQIARARSAEQRTAATALAMERFSAQDARCTRAVAPAPTRPLRVISSVMSRGRRVPREPPPLALSGAWTPAAMRGWGKQAPFGARSPSAAMQFSRAVRAVAAVLPKGLFGVGFNAQR